MSCDLLPTESPGPHYQGDVMDIINDGWDTMIGHPPCTHIAVSGARYFKEKIADGRQQSAIDFFMELANANIPRICIENPVCIMSSVWRKPDQYIQPWMFGHAETKKTGLWLKNLPQLKPSDILTPTKYRYTVTGNKSPMWDNQTKSGQNKLGPSEERAKIRAKTYQGIADAMADQWGNLDG